MNRVGLIVISALLAASYVRAATAQTVVQGEIGKFVIMPAGHTPLTDKNPPALFSAWRLNTETGALEFCTYDSGGMVIGNRVTAELLKCTPETR